MNAGSAVKSNSMTAAPSGIPRRAINCSIDCRQLIGNEMKRIRRKLHLTQKEAVKLLSGGGHNAFSRYERGELLRLSR